MWIKFGFELCVLKIAYNGFPPTAEKYKGEILHPKSHLEHINLLRKEIAGTIDTISKSMDSLIGTGIDVFKAIDLLREARFHYGFEIERLKNESDSVL